MKGRIFLRTIVTVSVLATAVWGGAWLLLSTPLGRVLGLNELSVTKQLTWQVPADTAPGERTLTVVATDQQGNSTEQQITIAVAAATTSAPNPSPTAAPLNEVVLKTVASSPRVSVGQEVLVDITVSSPQTVAAILADVSFSPLLEFVGVNTEGSVFEQEVTAPQVVDGRFQLSRISFGDGFEGQDGKVASIAFRAVGEGEAVVSLNQSESQVISLNQPANILQRVENAVLVLDNRSACVQVASSLRTRLQQPLAFSAVLVVIQDAAGQEVARFTQSSDAEGKIIVRDQTILNALNDTTAYTVIATPIGHLPQTLPSVTGILDGACRQTPDSSWGDIDGSGSIDLIDITRGLEFYRTGTDAVLQELYGEGNFGLIDLVQLIYLSRQQAQPTPTP